MITFPFIPAQEKANKLLKTQIQIMESKKCNQTLADNNKFTTRQLKNGLDGGQMCAHDPQAVNDTCRVLKIIL